jgi:hypothetical protein
MSKAGSQICSCVSPDVIGASLRLRFASPEKCCGGKSTQFADFGADRRARSAKEAAPAFGESTLLSMKFAIPNWLVTEPSRKNAHLPITLKRPVRGGHVAAVDGLSTAAPVRYFASEEGLYGGAENYSGALDLTFASSNLTRCQRDEVVTRR